MTTETQLRNAARRFTRQPVLVGDWGPIFQKEFWASVDGMASGLSQSAVGKGDIVAVLANRGPELVAIIQAIWRLGAVFLPVDPEYPTKRRQFMIDDAKPALVVGSAPENGRESTGAQHISFDELRALPVVDVAPVQITEDDAAYLIYTSGTTGQPKGVLVAHRGIVNLASAQSEVFAIDSSSVVLQFASPSFDAFISEVVTSLWAGASLALPRQERLLSARELREFVSKHSVTVATLPPSLLTLLSPSEMPSIKTMVAAGEACPTGVATTWGPSVRFVNAYGPTECTVCATMGRWNEGDPVPPSIGRLMSGVEGFVVDEALNLVAPGQEGELLLAGPSLALGYLNRPQETAAAFVTVGFGGGKRVYRTGDVVRQRENGDYVFCRRLDDQVKVSGYRIELHEVQNAIQQCEGVTRAEVLVRGAGALAQLCAFVECGEETTVDEIAAHCRGQLPGYMMPSIYVSLRSMPMTPNGKVDRKALLDRVGDGAAAASSGGDSVASIWAEILELSAVSADDVDFWDLGGSSLRLLQLVERIESQFDMRLSQQALLAQPITLSRLRDLVDAGSVDEDPAGFILGGPADENESEPMAFLFPPVTGDPYGMLGLGRRLAERRTVVCLASPGFFAGEPARDAKHLAEHYVAEIKRLVAPGASCLLVAYSAGAVHAFEAAHALSALGYRPQLIMIDGAAPQPEPIMDPKFFSVPAAGFTMSLMLSATLGQKPGLAVEALASMDPSQQMDAIRTELLRLGLVSNASPEGAAHRRFVTFRANIKGVAQYVAEPRELRALHLLSEGGHPFSPNPNVFNWNPFISQCEERKIPGGHFTVLGSHNVPTVASAINDWLDGK